METCSFYMHKVQENILNSEYLDLSTLTYAMTSAVVTFVCLSMPIRNDNTCPKSVLIVPGRIFVHILTFIFELPTRYVATTALLYQLVALRNSSRQHFFAHNTFIDMTCLFALCGMDALQTVV
jgi:hypothetical protein